MNYEDIICLQHPEPKNHARMSMMDRAAQFSPFAALTGFDDCIEEEKRIVDKKRVLSEEENRELNEKLQYLQKHEINHPKIKVSFFVKDIKKQGGVYIFEEKTVRYVDNVNKEICYIDNTKRKFSDIEKIILIEKENPI